MLDPTRFATYINEASTIHQLTGGFSHDEKWVVDERYLIRLFAAETRSRRREEADVLKRLNDAGVSQIPAFYAYDEGDVQDALVLGYVTGRNGVEALPEMTIEEQYDAGVQAGKALRHLHDKASAVFNRSGDWMAVRKRKNDRYRDAWLELPRATEMRETVLAFIAREEWRMEGRPFGLQHDDFHPSNLIFEGKEFTGMIDFERMDWGDPLFDLCKLGFFSVQTSVPFTNGVLAGYEPEPDESFWGLFALYGAIHLAATIVWAEKESPEHFTKLYTYAKRVVEDHDGFRSYVPAWYDPHAPRKKGGWEHAGT